MSPLLSRVPAPLRQLFWSAYGRSVWDAEHDDLADPLVRRVAEVVAAQQEVGGKVLDAGCGTGRYARVLAEQGYHVTAIDTAPGMLAHARQRSSTLPKNCSGTLAVETASVDVALPFADGSFDVVLLVSVLQAVAKPIFTLHEMHRVLAPDGVLCVVHFLPHPNKSLPLSAELKIRAATLPSTSRATRLWQLGLIALKSGVERQRVTHQWTSNDLINLMVGSGYVPRVMHMHSSVMVMARKQ